MTNAIDFEIKVKELIENELKQGNLGIEVTCAKVFHHKAYFSKERGKSITVDVSVELCRRNATEPYFLWIWECKNYSGLAPIDDVEEFHAKLEQIGEHKTKGTIICPNGFQSGAVEYARAKGIGLARMLPEGSMIMLLEARRVVTEKFIRVGLTEPHTLKLQSMFYGLTCSGEGKLSLSDVVAHEMLEVINRKKAN